MAQMQPPLGGGVVVLIMHPMLRLLVTGWLYYVSGFMWLFVIK